MSGNNQQRQQHVPMSQQMGKKDRSLPELLRFGPYICQAIPTIFSFLYASGMWEAKFDEYQRLKDFDVIIASFVVGVGIIGLLIIWFVQNKFESE